MQHRKPTKYYTQLSKVMIEKMIPVNDLLINKMINASTLLVFAFRSAKHRCKVFLVNAISNIMKILTFFFSLPPTHF